MNDTNAKPKSEPPEADSVKRIIPLLGIYLVLTAALLVLLVYAFWPVVESMTNGDPVWNKAIRFFTKDDAPIEIGNEARLLILVMLAGGLGSYVHAATSFVTYVGNRSLVPSWMWWYLLRPFIGMALALIFYFVVRGGLLSAGATASEVSPFGVTAVAGLVGMFSKQATDKLQELFDNLFKTETGKGDDERGDKLNVTLSVLDKMIPVNKMTFVKIPKGESERDINIVEVFEKYGGFVSRIPVIDDRKAVKHIIHQSLIYKFISAKSVEALKTNTSLKMDTLTLEDFLNFEDMREYVSNSIAFVSRHATIGEAKTRMDNTLKCQDVFITEHGSKDEALEGWLTNVDIGRLSKA